MDIRNSQYASIGQITNQYLQKRKTNFDQTNSANSVSFSDLLESKKNEASSDTYEVTLKFSKHANQRVESRNIELSGEVLQRLEDGTRKAQEKGIKESLVMIDSLAFIVNVPSNTVVTAVTENENKIFTNIDGAVIA
ncbi:TIGR02530 family flagellar biosynthesis protein [Anaerosporobacter faecicola]|uniref:TIGR02530 family flagellar biosynthesis protein n=1 Tax=Anaerosporobacter faecicola TaxID=2718714 RepID=UPI00143AB290|nr:TIGR02530 family flagellar biosynthesis protein [Anaerosporobacter faecicola]